MQPLENAPKPAQLTDASVPAQRSKVWHNVAVRLADEGVPLRAISRALMLPYEEVSEVLAGAVERGMLISSPREDWPIGTRRDDRLPDMIPLEYEDEHVLMLSMRTFRFTPAEARMFVLLLRRAECGKDMLHTATKKNEPVEPTDMKIVDVFICKMRKKLPDNINIITIWGRGYYIPPECKPVAYEALKLKHNEYVNTGSVM